jgi:hypothetical protein
MGEFDHLVNHVTLLRRLDGIGRFFHDQFA